MGGGVGLSLHAPFRLATERTLFAMPETGIGYFPDVGVTRCLARLDGKVGQYLGMTGARISGQEAYLLGIATHYVPSSSLDAVADRLAHLPQDTSAAQLPRRVADALDEYSVDPFATTPDEAGEKAAAIWERTPFLGATRVALDYAFGQPSAEAVQSALNELASGAANTQAVLELTSASSSTAASASGNWGLTLEEATGARVVGWARETLGALRTKSPRSLKVTHQAISEARRLDVDEAFRFDMRLATAFCDLSIGRDFYAGVTHTLEKDPRTGKRRTGVADWQPKTLAEVDDALTRAQFFADVETARREGGLRMQVPLLDGLPSSSPSSSGQTREARRAQEAALRGRGPLGWEAEHNAFALPSEAECAALLQGAHPAAGSMRLEPEELADVLRRHKGDKPALERKVRDWAERVGRRRL